MEGLQKNAMAQLCSTAGESPTPKINSQHNSLDAAMCVLSLDQPVVHPSIKQNNTNPSPCLIFPQCNSDAADSVAGLHVSILNGLSELILQAQHLRDQFQ